MAKVILFQGNIGSKYSKTRHNIAFEFADFLVEKYNLIFQEKPKFKAFIAEFSRKGEKIILVKPTTFYNLTGESARLICDFYKVDFKKDFLVIHDDISLDFGVIRTRKKGTDGGNNGLKSIISTFGEEFCRMKIGISNEVKNLMGTSDFVLAKFTEEENSRFASIFKICQEFTEDFICSQFENSKKSIDQHDSL